MSVRRGIVIGIIMAVLAGFLGTSSLAWSQEMDKPTGTEIAFDLIIARPLGLVGCALGTTLFLVSFPLAVVTGSERDTAHALVAEPYHFTFVRGLGEY
jgi:uncharacterized protein involved in response to NO